MHSNAYTYRFIIIITGVAALLLSLAATGLKDRQDFNRALDTKKNILKSVNLYDKEMDPAEIEESYKSNISEKYVTDVGEYSDNAEDLLLYEYINDRKIEGYIIPISGKGLWSTIYGIFALKPDKKTVMGITFYDHGETPGLGGEIEKEWFTSQFPDKKIFDSEHNLLSVTISKGKSIKVDDYHVDGVSGATLTTKGVNEFLFRDLKSYENFLKKSIQS